MYLQHIVLFLLLASGGLSQYTFDDSRGLGRTFDGIGGLSGGGVRKNINQCYKYCLGFFQPGSKCQTSLLSYQKRLIMATG